ncbi:MAG: hypothetical protein KF887_15210 [Paracoccaceae bacterium]|nr:MAG: hypothetical protein KF887_15210 [Paracoccaceae bacterium]
MTGNDDFSEPDLSRLVDRFVMFKKSDRIFLYTLSKNDSKAVNTACRQFLRKMAALNYVEQYRIESVGEWIGINIDTISKGLVRFSERMISEGGNRTSGASTRPWKNPDVFRYFVAGVVRGRSIAKNFPANNESTIRFEVVSPE